MYRYRLGGSELPDTAAMELSDLLYFCLVDTEGTLLVTETIASRALAAAVLIDLIDDARVRLDPDEGVLRLYDAQPPASALAHQVLEAIAFQKPSTVEEWLGYWVASDFLATVTERLIYRGYLERQARRRRLRGTVVVAYPPVHRTLPDWVKHDLQRRFTGGPGGPESSHVRLYGLLMAVDATGPLGEAAGLLSAAALHRGLGSPLYAVLKRLHAVSGSAAMTGGA